MNSRHLKVSYQSVPSQQPYTRLPPMPFCVCKPLVGRAGFDVETDVRVQVEPGPWSE